jgi:hypothetical protein
LRFSKVGIVAVSCGETHVARTSLLGSILSYALLVGPSFSILLVILTGILSGSGLQLFHSWL